ncbi:MAG: aldo/keto reductase, partial [Candidatus Marinimicrobia bacterium]|nr:aldo/keto reductase [Candidatus Neomarinimicrobiota bacterium]
MKKITFGRTNVKVSTISLGTWSYGSGNVSGGRSVGWADQSDTDSRAALIQAWKSGINHWDTADVYGNGHSEKIIGNVWDIVTRNDIFLATKVGWDMGGFNHYYHPKMIKEHIDFSLKNLQTDVIDLYYFHHCNFDSDSIFEDALDLVRHFRDEGKIRFIGLSDWDSVKIMKYIDRVNPDVIQPYRNVMDDPYKSSGLKDWVEKNNAGIAFFSPIKNGLLTGKYDKPPIFKEGDFRLNVPEFQDKDLLIKLQDNRLKLNDKFSGHTQPILHGLLGALLTDSPTGCVLLGQRDVNQVKAAAELGEKL